VDSQIGLAPTLQRKTARVLDVFEIVSNGELSAGALAISMGRRQPQVTDSLRNI
jgi:hypothetical protein